MEFAYLKKMQSSDVVSEEFKEQMNKLGVRHFGFVEKKDVHGGIIWRRRCFFIVQGRLFHVKDSDAHMASAVEMSKRSPATEASDPTDDSRSLDLPPGIAFIDVSATELTVHIKGYNPAEETVFAAATWGLKTTRTEEEKILHGVRTYFQLRFASEAMKNEWKHHIKTESLRSFLPAEVAKEFSQSFHELVWRSIRHPNILVAENMIFRHLYFGNDGTALGDGFNAFAQRLIWWYCALLNREGDLLESDLEGVILLFSHAAQCPAFRALVVMTNPMPEVLNGFGLQQRMGSATNEEKFATFICTFSDFLKTADDVGLSFLVVSSHPSKIHQTGEEFEWNQRFVGLFDFTWKSFSLMLKEPAYLPYRLLYHDVSLHNYSPFPKLHYALFLKEFVSDFVVPSDLSEEVTCYHFVGLILLGKENNICQTYNECNRLNDQFIKALMRRGLSFAVYKTAVAMPIVTLSKILESIVFVDGDKSKGFRFGLLKVVPKLPVIIIEMILEFRENELAAEVGGSHQIKELVSLALLLEYSKNFGELQSRVETLSSYSKKHNSFAQKVVDLLKALQFHRFLRVSCTDHIQRAATPLAAGDDSNATALCPAQQSGEPKISKNLEVHYPVYGFLKMCFITEPSHPDKCLTDPDFFFLFVSDFQAGMFFHSLLGRNEDLRRDVILALRDELKFGHHIYEMMTDGELLYESDHFTKNAIAVYHMQPGTVDLASFKMIIATAFYLEDRTNLASRLSKIVTYVQISKENLAQLNFILHYIVQHFREDCLVDRWVNRENYTGVKLETLRECAHYVCVAMKVMSRMPDSKGRNKIERMIKYYLVNKQPKLWVSAFKSTETIAFFILYMNRESIDLAYTKFSEINAADRQFATFIEEVKMQYSKPFVSAADVDSLVDQGSDGAAVEAFIESLANRGRSSPESAAIKLLIEVTARWMENRYHIIGIPMAPRNAQIITVLMCVRWTEHMLSGVGSKSIIAQVGTGEGKSLVIAMMAIYFVKVRGKRVHVLENNLGLLQKDVAQFEEIYRTFGINCTAACGLSTDAWGAPNSASITYCLRSMMEDEYRNNTICGIPPFENVVLIVDEVDDLIVDDNPNRVYTNLDDDSPKLREYFEALLIEGLAAVKPAGASDACWKFARDGFEEVPYLVLNQHYVLQGGKYVGVNERGDPCYRKSVEFLNYKDFSIPPSMHSNFYYQSLPHMLSQYTNIVGFSGSLGSPAEREFLRETYGTWCFEVPPFLNTCAGALKSIPVLIDDCVHVFPDVENQFAKVADLSMKLFVDVPVVIICKDSAEADILFARLQLVMGNSVPAGKSVEDFIQRFAQYLPDSCTPDKDHWGPIVEKATAKVTFSDALGDHFRYPITITEPFGGRGTDFMISDEDVDAHGGLAVIMTSIPGSEREWTQWKGRTARNDRKGQYAVVLSMMLDSLVDYQEPDRRGTSKYMPSLISTLLNFADEETRARLQQLKPLVDSGKWINELCDRFFQKFGGIDEVWPTNEHHLKLRDFLLDFESVTRAKLMQFVISSGLANSAEEYQRESQYFSV